MGPLVIVEVEVAFQADGQGRHRWVVIEVDVLVFDGAPEPLNEDGVKGAASAVHADLATSRFEAVGEGLGSELVALVGVEDGRRAAQQGQLQGFQTKGGVEGIGQHPRQDEATVPVNNGNQVHETTGHGNVGNVDSLNANDKNGRFRFLG